MKRWVVLPLAIACGLAAAETPRQVIATYTAEAAAQTVGFRPSAQRGGDFFARKFGVSDKMPACATCHTENPAQIGRHAVTGKEIKPLAPAANAERFTDAAKVEKWFRRNCKEVVGRECSPGEKADVIEYLAGLR
jgi:hypothetical protein